jgi:glucokinase
MDHLAGIDIGGTTVKIGIVRGAEPFGVFKTGSIPTRPQDPPDVFAQRVASAIRELMAATGGGVRGVGIGCPGLIDPKRGLVRTSPNLPNLPMFPLRDRLAELIGLEAEIQNDANAAALGEWLYGPNRGVNNLIMITLGTGVGGGVICDGHLLIGADNAAAELGHIKVEHTDGAPCGCGKTGCLEAYAGAAGIIRMAHSFIRDNPGKTRLVADSSLTTRSIADAAAGGDDVAREVLARVGEYIGRGLALFIEIFNPEVIVLGGGASGAFGFFRPGIERSLDRYCSFPVTRNRCRIERSAFPDDINVIGAAAAYLDRHRP